MKSYPFLELFDFVFVRNLADKSPNYNFNTNRNFEL